MSEAKPSGLGRRPTRMNTAPLSIPKRLSTKELLIEVGEQLFGRHGFEGISLREIAVAAEQSNRAVVQYHFQDKSGLIGAILADRSMRTDSFRLVLLENLRKNSRQYARDLLKVLWLPAIEIRSADGSHTYCQFLLQLMLQPRNFKHPLYKFYNAHDAAEADGTEPLLPTVKATLLLRAHFNKLPPLIFKRRMQTLNLMFLAAVVEHDNLQWQCEDGSPTEFDIEPILDMSIGALTAKT